MCSHRKTWLETRNIFFRTAGELWGAGLRAAHASTCALPGLCAGCGGQRNGEVVWRPSYCEFLEDSWRFQVFVDVFPPLLNQFLTTFCLSGCSNTCFAVLARWNTLRRRSASRCIKVWLSPVLCGETQKNLVSWGEPRAKDSQINKTTSERSTFQHFFHSSSRVPLSGWEKADESLLPGWHLPEPNKFHGKTWLSIIKRASYFPCEFAGNKGNQEPYRFSGLFMAILFFFVMVAGGCSICWLCAFTFANLAVGFHYFLTGLSHCTAATYWNQQPLIWFIYIDLPSLPFLGKTM